MHAADPAKDTVAHMTNVSAGRWPAQWRKELMLATAHGDPDHYG